MITVYLDECVDHYVISYLQTHSIVVRTAQAEGMSAAEDDDQIRHAHKSEWIILSTNEKDFIGWHTVFRRNEWQHSGIVTVPQTAVRIRLLVRCAMMLDWIAAEFPDPRNQLFRWTDLQQRLISGYFLEGYTDAEIALALGRATTLP